MIFSRDTAVTGVALFMLAGATLAAVTQSASSAQRRSFAPLMLPSAQIAAAAGVPENVLRAPARAVEARQYFAAGLTDAALGRPPALDATAISPPTQAYEAGFGLGSSEAVQLDEALEIARRIEEGNDQIRTATRNAIASLISRGLTRDEARYRVGYAFLTSLDAGPAPQGADNGHEDILDRYRADLPRPSFSDREIAQHRYAAARLDHALRSPGSPVELVADERMAVIAGIADALTGDLQQVEERHAKAYAKGRHAILAPEVAAQGPDRLIRAARLENETLVRVFGAAIRSLTAELGITHGEAARQAAAHLTPKPEHQGLHEMFRLATGSALTSDDLIARLAPLPEAEIVNDPFASAQDRDLNAEGPPENWRPSL